MMLTAVRLVILLLLLLATAGARADEALWRLLREGGQVVMIRHASTGPGGGDPPGFRLEDCATQRNLSDAGRQEARRLGEAFRARGIPVGGVLSSEWCRCLETARLAFGRAEAWPALNSYFNDPSRDRRWTSVVSQRAGERPADGNLILVTHNFNIRAVTGVSPREAELVILTPRGDGTFAITGRIPPSAF